MTAATLAPYPTSLPELLAAGGDTARALAGADRSAWNGHIIESDGAMLGLAHWDGTLYLDRESIVDPLRHLYDHAGERRPDQTLLTYRESLATLLHEHAHFLGPEHATQEEARQAFTKPGSRQLEEGVTEAWAQDHLDDFIHRLGIDKVAPGIDSVRSGGFYPAFVPAVRELTTHLDNHHGFSPGRTLTLLNRQTAAGQFPLLTDLVCETLSEPDPAEIESTLRAALTRLEAKELAPPEQATDHSLTTAADLLTTLQATSPTRPFEQGEACTLPPPHTTAFSGVAPPTRTSLSPSVLRSHPTSTAGTPRRGTSTGRG